MFTEVGKKRVKINFVLGDIFFQRAAHAVGFIIKHSEIVPYTILRVVTAIWSSCNKVRGWYSS